MRRGSKGASCLCLRGPRGGWRPPDASERYGACCPPPTSRPTADSMSTLGHEPKMYRSRTRLHLTWALLAVSSACAWPGSQPGGVASAAADHTLIVDYSQNCVRELDGDGKEVSRLDEIYGAWDAERLDNGNTLLVEFSVSRVSEVDPSGEIVWSYEDLKNPYAASRLPDGTTLIANTFGGEVRVAAASSPARRGREPSSSTTERRVGSASALKTRSTAAARVFTIGAIVARK